MKASLSKSQFIRGLQCHKALWLYRNRKDLIPKPAPAQQMIFDQGHEVGILAQKRFPGGVLIAEDHTQTAQSLTSTAAAVKAGAKVLYEAGAVYDNVLVRADIIAKTKDGKAWDLIEVKSSTEVKEVYLNDVAVQLYVLEGADFPIRKAFLMHVNNEYVRKGPIDPQGLFALEDVTEEARDRQGTVPKELKAMQAMLAKSQAPTIDIGTQCFTPYTCDFQDHCWAKVPAYSVFNLGGARMEKKFGWWHDGITAVADIPEDGLSHAQELQVKVAKSKKPHIDAEGIAEVLGELTYPLHFLDFETVNLALPPYDGLRPYQQMPFQASIHIQERKNGPLRHVEYLGDGRSDPRPGMAAYLTKSIGPKGTVVAYNAGFEGQCLEALAAAFPKHSKALMSAKDRLWDLGTPFRKALYVHPKFQGSWSIKVVLPTLVPDMTYENLEIGDGGQAQIAYLSMMTKSLSERDLVRIMKDLKVYCGQDTLAMVKVLATLQAVRNLNGPS